ncbi:MAG: hypothetical protein GW795_03220, partial [Cyanobacteria bacterium]|nr:hypothetical protein [Cyanobacteria bacterium CG_2015-04_32_10]
FEQAVKALQNEQINKAEILLKKIENANLNNAQYWNLKGILSVKKQKLSEAANYFKKAIDLDKSTIDFHYHLSTCYKKQAMYDDAFDILLIALQLDKKNQKTISYLYNLFDIFPESSTLLESFINNVLNGKEDKILLNKLGIVYCNRLKFSQAIFFYKKALIIEPLNQIYLINFTLAVITGQHFKQGIAFLQFLKSKIHEPNSLDVFISIIKLRAKDWIDYEKTLKVIKNDVVKTLQSSDGMTNITAFEALNFIADKAMNLEIAKRMSKSDTKFQFKHAIDISKKHKKLRVGYISSDFRDHPVMHLIKTMFDHFDPNKVESYIYSCGADDNSEYRQYIRDHVTKFEDVSNFNFKEIADIIHQDNVDILVDLQGLTSSVLIKVLAYRPAPIQISYIGYASSSGADYIDYIIVDKIITPLSDQKYFTEKFIYMPHCYLVNDGRQAISTAALTKADYGLPEDKFIYCCFNNPYKIEPDIFAIWMNILKAVPNSVLWLLYAYPDEQVILREYAKQQGINPKRIIFAGKLKKSKHLKRLQLADLFLDTYIVGAHTTASDSLWAGVPILTCTGDRFISRVCTSMLAVQGLTALITKDLEEYQQKAIYYGTHPEQIKSLKQEIQAANRNKPLFNTPQFADELTRAYQLVWERYCEGLPPDNIEVEKK